MLFALLSLLSAQAETGRTLATALVGVAPAGQALVRGTADYGLTDRLSLTGELGTQPGFGALTAGGGLMVHAIDSQWWRVSALAMPEFVVSFDGAPARGWSTGVGPITVAARAGVRVDWLAFWGLCFVARADRVAPFDGAGGWWEVSGGLAGRL